MASRRTQWMTQQRLPPGVFVKANVFSSCTIESSPNNLVLPLHNDAIEDVDDVAANRAVDVEVGIEVELLDVVEDRAVDVEARMVPLALLVLAKVGEINESLVPEVLGENPVLPLHGDVLEDIDDVAANRVVEGQVDIEVELHGVVEDRAVDVGALLMTLALLLLDDDVDDAPDPATLIICGMTARRSAHFKR
eukprot:3168221-Amphidinium_carterae.1